MIRAVAASVFALVACTARSAAPRPPATFLKGQLHVHTDNSGDSTTPAAEVAAWYVRHGFDFVVFTDHNAITTYRDPALLTIPGVELTRNVDRCDPPATTDLGCLMHVNALFLDARATADGDRGVDLPATGRARLDHYAASIAQARALGGIAMLNHPNMAWMMDAPMITALAARGAVLLEIANQNEQVSSAGDAAHPSTEALWDQALTAGATIWGVATDDAHHYDDAPARRAAGDEVYVGDLGWVMVRAARDPAAIRAALVAGDFYASTGVTLRDVRVDDGALVIEGDAALSVAFIGTGGAVLAHARGPVARYRLADAPPGYLRAVAVDAAGHKAWTQPVRTR